MQCSSCACDFGLGLQLHRISLADRLWLSASASLPAEPVLSQLLFILNSEYSTMSAPIELWLSLHSFSSSCSLFLFLTSRLDLAWSLPAPSRVPASRVKISVLCAACSDRWCPGYTRCSELPVRAAASVSGVPRCPSCSPHVARTFSLPGSLRQGTCPIRGYVGATVRLMARPEGTMNTSRNRNSSPRLTTHSTRRTARAIPQPEFPLQGQLEKKQLLRSTSTPSARRIEGGRILRISAGERASPPSGLLRSDEEWGDESATNCEINLQRCEQEDHATSESLWGRRDHATKGAKKRSREEWRQSPTTHGTDTQKNTRWRTRAATRRGAVSTHATTLDPPKSYTALR